MILRKGIFWHNDQIYPITIVRRQPIKVKSKRWRVTGRPLPVDKTARIQLEQREANVNKWKRGKVSKETMILRQWGSIARSFWFFQLGNRNEFKVAFWALTLSRSEWRNCGLCVCVFLSRKWSHATDGKNKNKLVEWKAFANIVGIMNADLKDKLLFKSFAASPTA